LRRHGGEPTIRTVGNLAALRQWAETCEPDFSHLICIGGDATLSAAAHAAIRTDVPFVPVPNGFGNLFARVFGFPDRAEGVVALLETGQVRRVDVGAGLRRKVDEIDRARKLAVVICRDVGDEVSRMA